MRGFSAAGAVIGTGAMVVSLVAVPAALAQSTEIDRTVRVTHSCVTRGAGGTAATISPNDIQVTYPESVRPGEVYTATIWPGEMRSGSETGRFTYALALPPNVDVINVANGGGDYGLLTSSGRSLAVELVDSSGDPHVDGTHVRISAGMTPNFGGDTASHLTLPYQWGVGLHSRENTNFRLPKVEVTLRAPVDRTPTPIKIGLHGGTGGQSNGTNNALQYLHTGTWSLGQRYHYCGRTYPAGSDSLTATAITSDAPLVAQSSAEMIGEDRAVAGGENTSLIARVAVSGASGREMSRGRVTFRRTDTGEVLGTATPNRDSGEAVLTRSFPGTMDGYSFEVTATYDGVVRGGVQSIAGSSASGSLGVTINPNRIAYLVNITQARRLPDSGGSVPVELTTTISRPGGGAFATGLQAQLYRDGQPVGAPRPATSTMTFTDSLPRAEAARTYYYEVKLLPLTVGEFEHGGQTAGATGVIITGTSPTVPEDLEFVDAPWNSSEIFVPGGLEGSLEFGAGSIGSVSPFVTGAS
ncbi:hypothetical protein NCCP2495_07900 [Dietzia sp. NCCP-2495]|uniref:hypothetical protein n=1 Tax=Dietzia sp. NCCP-2495 TaxID=2934675 RepID=UPI0022326268|nr:hypothetical protein [Dietzia sp. NCCP-2495]GLB62912.1 hypothetical protein NCCP2495_07900 [Dietzia sp. NCCP-2495]